METAANNEFLDELRETIARLLPMLMLMLVASAVGMFALAVLLPKWGAYNEMMLVRDSKQREVDALLFDDTEVTLGILNRQLDDLQAEIDAASTHFFSEDHADTILDNLYHYARDVGVQVTNVRLAESSEPLDLAAPYHLRTLRVQVNGDAKKLMHFVIRFREAQLNSVKIANLSISESDEMAQLVMDIQVYISPYATSDPYAGLETVAYPEIEAAIPVESGVAVAGAADETAALTTGDASVNGEGGSITVDDACAGLEPTLFAIGDTAVVDFNASSALNLLDNVRTPGGEEVDVIYLLRDDSKVEIINGPVCGEWEGKPVRYWYVSYYNMQGWVGELTTENRWLCPVDNTECAG